ncbi:MAG TPA: hypothetical protein VM617_00610 [Thermoanaerobaculia bacterium]|nr:hypothetical protein [Thermoanaerobaculia bacterium]
MAKQTYETHESSLRCAERRSDAARDALGERIEAALEALEGSDASAVADLELPATGVATQLRGAGIRCAGPPSGSWAR